MSDPGGDQPSTSEQPAEQPASSPPAGAGEPSSQWWPPGPPEQQPATSNYDQGPASPPPNPHDHGEQPPYGQPPYGYGQQPPPGYGYPPAGYGQPPYGYGQQPPPGYGYPPAGYGQPPYTNPTPPAQPVERSPEERRKRVIRIVAYITVPVIAMGAGIGIGAAIAPTNPTTVARALASNAISASTHAGTYSYRELSTASGLADNIVGEAAPSSGRQVITETCSGATSVFDLRLVKGTVYFKGNATAVADQLGVNHKTSAKTTNHWVKVTSGEFPYKTFEEGITTKSNITQLSSSFLGFTSAKKSTTTTISGNLESDGKAVGTATLVIATSSSLPKTFNAKEVEDGHTLTLSWTFSNFGEKISVNAPASPIAFSSLSTKKPAKTLCA